MSGSKHITVKSEVLLPRKLFPKGREGWGAVGVGHGKWEVGLSSYFLPN